MTLIEVMVALAMLSLLSIGMISAFRAGERTYRQLREADVAEQDVLMAQRFLRNILESAYPFQPASSDRSTFGLQGTADQLELTAPMPRSLGSAGYYRYWLEVERTSSGSRNLIVRWAVDRNGGSLATPPSDPDRREALVQDIEGLEWSYATTSVAESGAVSQREWVHSWTGTQTLPSLVRLHVAFPRGDSRRWPDLIVAPRITDDANCRFDTVSQRCREIGS